MTLLASPATDEIQFGERPRYDWDRPSEGYYRSGHVYPLDEEDPPGPGCSMTNFSATESYEACQTSCAAAKEKDVSEGAPEELQRTSAIWVEDPVERDGGAILEGSQAGMGEFVWTDDYWYS